jgi:hypothetical protein
MKPVAGQADSCLRPRKQEETPRRQAARAPEINHKDTKDTEEKIPRENAQKLLGVLRVFVVILSSWRSWRLGVSSLLRAHMRQPSPHRQRKKALHIARFGARSVGDEIATEGSMRPAIIVFACAATVAGCGQEAAQKPHAAKSRDTTIADTAGQYRLRTGGSDGGPPPVPVMSFANGKGFEPPSYIPVYPGATIRSGFERNHPGGSGGTIIFETKARASDVIAFYRRTAAASAFSETASGNNGGTLSFTAQAGRRSIQVIAEPIAQGSHVQIFWSGIR